MLEMRRSDVNLVKLQGNGDTFHAYHTDASMSTAHSSTPQLAEQYVMSSAPNRVDHVINLASVCADNSVAAPLTIEFDCTSSLALAV